MRIQMTASSVAALLLVGVSLAGQSQRNKTSWTAPRMSDGHPDMQGVWANNSMTPLERPALFGMRATMSDAELNDLKQKAKVLTDGGDAFFGEELFNAALAGKTKFTSSDTQTGNYDQTWLSERVFDNRTSLIIDPSDGRVPALVPEAVERQQRQAAARRVRGPADQVQDMALGTRCVTFGTPNILAGYQSYFEINQGPGVFALRSETIHDERIFPIDGGAHLSQKLALYHGDSRAHWEGDTLVVDTTNLKPGAFRGSTERLRVTEKFRRVAEDTLEYYITIDDASTWSRPWTFMLLLKKTGERMFEYACHEGNYSLSGILAGARAAEKD
jgi:hypothetical protein